MMRMSMPSRQRGVGLIEVLIALVVVSIGCLASAQMQLRGMQDAQNTYHQSQASLLISEMMERMRNNPDGVSGSHYSGKTTHQFTKPTCTGACTAQQQAELDLYAWSSNFEMMEAGDDFVPALPSDQNGNPAYGSITAEADGVFLLSIHWSDRVAGDVADESVSVRFTP